MNPRAAATSALAARLGHAFKDAALLERALTHASASSTARRLRDNEVLEFIGDRVIGLLAAERLAELDREASEGDLAPRLNQVVSRAACAEVARRAGIGPALRLAPGETRTGGRDKDSILAGACEAVLAAVYTDGGLDAARRVFLDLWGPLLEASARADARDSKTILQEWAHRLGRPLPSYAIVRRSGPDHAPTFVVEVKVDGLEPHQAEGRSRQEAEKRAAAGLLEREGV